MGGIVKTFHRRHQVHHSAIDNSEHIMECTERNLQYFSHQIDTVEESNMELVKDGYIQKTPTQWVKKATDLKSQVVDALQEQKNSNDRSLRYEYLKLMRQKIYLFMEVCPLVVVSFKLTPCMHYTDDRNLSDSNDDKEVVCSDRKGKDTGKHSHNVPLVEPYGLPTPKVSSENTMSGGNVEGESSQVHDAVIPEISPKDSTSTFISQAQDENKNESSTIQEVDALDKNLPELQVESTSYSQESKHHEKSVTRLRQTAHVVLGITIPISLADKVSVYVQLRLQVLGMSMSPSQATFHLINDGLDPKMDNYLFLAIENPEELEAISQSTLMGGQQPSGTVKKSHADGASLPKNLIVNRSGSTSKEKPTAEEWHQARVVNLIESTLLLDEEPDCPDLMILFLQRNRRLTRIPPTFFNQMPSLHFLDLSYTRIRALPSSLFMLTNLQVLLLRSCVYLDSLPAEIKKLRNMEVLDLLGTDLSDLPAEIGKLTQLRHLWLSFYRPDYGSKNADSQSELVSSGAIFQLQALQGLSIAVHHKDQHWKRIVKDIIKQVGELKMLTYLEFYFPNIEALKYFSEVSLSWKEQRLRSFKFLVGHNIKRVTSRVPDEVESKYEQYDQCLRFVNGNEVSEVMKGILKSVTAFYLDHHIEIQSLSEFDISNFKELKFCVLRECPNIQVMTIGENRTESAFPNLEHLGLHYLWKLEKIWEDPVPPGSYQALKYLRIGTCGKLEYVASHSILQRLFNLEIFIIEDCESLKTIVKENEMVKYDDIPLLPRLKELVLRHLPQLVDLGRGLFPSEEIITIYFCPKLILRPGHSRSGRNCWNPPTAMLPKLKF